MFILIDNNRQLVIESFAVVPNPLTLPNSEQVSGAFSGWTSQDGAYSLAAVTIAAQPSFNPITQSCVQNAAPTLVDGVWTLGWTVASLTDDQVKANVTAQVVAQAPAVAASYAAGLRRKAATLQKQGKTWEAVQLLLQVQGIRS